MLTQVGEQFGLDVNIVDQKVWDLQGKSSCHKIVKEGTHTVFPASYLIAVVVVELSHVQLSASIINNQLTNDTPHLCVFCIDSWRV